MCQEHFIFLTLLIMSMNDFCPLPVPDIGPSVFVCDVEHTSFHFDWRLPNLQFDYKQTQHIV